MPNHPLVNQHLAFTGASTHPKSPYATTSSVSYAKTFQKPGMVPPATPTTSSGYIHAFFRDDPPAGAGLDSTSMARGSWSRPHTATLEEMDYKFDAYAPKDALPLKSCLKRGEIKEPRFHPFKDASELGAHKLISPSLPREVEYTQRWAAEPVGIHGKGMNGMANANIMANKGVTPESGFSLGNSNGKHVKAMITAKQGQVDFREPALTMLQSERVQMDSTRRFFHARDHYEQPFLSSSAYFQNDVMAAHEQMKARGEGLTVAPTLRPLTQYALAKAPVPYDEPPFAPDTEASWMMPVREQPGPVPIAHYAAQAAGVQATPALAEQKLPTGFSRVKGLTTEREEPSELPDAPPLPERFRRERARRDYLKWGANDDNMYASIQRAEMIKPSSQRPLGGELLRGGERIVATDSSGYMKQVLQSPVMAGAMGL